ncbi:hypothetical protein [Fibrobacter sp.]|uniref:hypothetical protein n=1 Tax=Fibrobacter sp. TaxID=35828 RepID=UPI0025BD0AFA|nr:hypothetical protein [Fibrobacter sp.]MCI6436476.1 hypothetical protein [Fibrobacter sp.]MDD5941833.1 hypothetical protein [Fibrobacter sp.]MDD7496689.1 hypothetical protein [Fibrobacter sp.]MDY5723189.1 hypothetical protein [Fibrobacter sp.]
MKLQKLNKLILRIGVVVGVIAMLMGTILTVAVWNEGYFVGAMMMIVTGAISIFLGFKELLQPSDHEFHWLPLFYKIVRRSFFFLNAVLIGLVVLTVAPMLE